ncbi:MAG: flavin monoamine oxidase family protein [Terriglobales bacterium]
MMTRRNFVGQVGRAGGFTAAFSTMQLLGLMPARAEPRPELRMERNRGAGVRVVVLGGGIAGLAAAWELRRHGFECTVLEARERPGGRNWTVRRGTRIALNDGSVQTCAFDPGNYQNVGAARLPSVHGTMLSYCKELGVKLEVEVNTSRSTFLQDDTVNRGRPLEQRQVINDTRGQVSELLDKCVAGGALDQELSPDDIARMGAFLRSYGPLDAAGAYRGSERAGYSVRPGAGDDAGTLHAPMGLEAMLDTRFWRGELAEEEFDWQPTMFQPVGGMDRIAYAFARGLGDVVHYNAEVLEIRRQGARARIVYTEHGQQRQIESDYCICAMPLSIVQSIPTDFSPSYQQVIAAARYSPQYKIAWEARRFWEQDYNIYGGLSYVAGGCSPIWYPSADLFSARGVLVGGYSAESPAFAAASLEGKLAMSRASIEKLHPGHGRELEKGLYVGWAHVPWNLGAWINWFGRNAPGANAGYEVLIQPDGPFYFAGDHVSHINAWQEGAALSALRAVQLIGDRVKAA